MIQKPIDTLAFAPLSSVRLPMERRGAAIAASALAVSVSVSGHLAAAYRLTPYAPLTAMPPTPAPCRWYDLARGGRTTAICWDAVNALPLLIANGPGHPVWRVLSIDRSGFGPETFRADDRGYIHDDATRDISNDCEIIKGG